MFLYKAMPSVALHNENNEKLVLVHWWQWPIKNDHRSQRISVSTHGINMIYPCLQTHSAVYPCLTNPHAGPRVNSCGTKKRFHFITPCEPSRESAISVRHLQSAIDTALTQLPLRSLAIITAPSRGFTKIRI